MPPPNETLADRFEIGALVGAGRSGEVYRGRDRETSLDVAVRRYPRDAIGEEIRPQFEREVGILVRASSRHVVRYVAHGRDRAAAAFVATEWLEGETLAARLVRDGSLSLDAALIVVDQAAEGLVALHARGLVHGDIKPGNIYLVGEAPRVAIKLIDVAVARHLDAAATSPGYLSPERVRGEGASFAGDLYALAVVFFECVTGRRLSPSDDRAAVRARAGEAPAPRLRSVRPDLPSALDDALYRALAHEPSARFTTPRELASALAAGVDPGSVEGDADEITLRIHDPTRRARRAITSRSAAERASTPFDSLIARADASIARARIAAALVDARAALIAAGDDAERRLIASLRIAQAETEDARPVEAAAALRDALANAGASATSPSGLLAQVEQARLQVLRGRARAALEATVGLAEAHRGSAELRAPLDAAIGEASLAVGDFDAALAAWKRGRACVEPAHAVAAGVGLGRTLVQLGAYADAAAVLNDAHREASRAGLLGCQIAALAVRGVARARMEQHAAGLADALRAVGLASRAALPRAGAHAALCAARLALETAGGRDHPGAMALRAASAAIEPFAPLRAVADAVRASMALACGEAEEAARLAADAFLLVERSAVADGAEGFVLLAYVNALRAGGRARECDGVLAQGHARLLARAATLRDEVQRAAFLEDVPEHRELLALAARAR